MPRVPVRENRGQSRCQTIRRPAQFPFQKTVGHEGAKCAIEGGVLDERQAVAVGPLDERVHGPAVTFCNWPPHAELLQHAQVVLRVVG